MVEWLARITAPLNDVLFTVGSDHVSWAELLGFLTGGACVWLTVRRHIANFPVGLANSALFLVLFCSARLWADGLLQVVYLALGAIGWWQWHTGRGDSAGDTAPLRVRWAGRVETVACLGFVVVGTGALTLILTAAQDIAPFLDSLTTSLSLAAQWLPNRKRIQTWFFWIAADLVYVPLYAAKHLVLTAVVYVLFLGLCVAGLRAWLAARPRKDTPVDRHAVAAR